MRPKTRSSRVGAFDYEWYTGLAVNTDGGPLHRLILGRTCHLEEAQTVRAGQPEIGAAARACPNRGTDHLREISAMGRFASPWRRPCLPRISGTHTSFTL